MHHHPCHTRVNKEVTNCPSSTMEKEDPVPVIHSPPQIIRLVTCCGSSVDVGCNVTIPIKNSSECDAFPSFPHPTSYLSFGDEEACIVRRYYNMDTTNHNVNNLGGKSPSLTDFCKRPLFSLILVCLMMIFGIVEMLRKISSRHDT